MATRSLLSLTRQSSSLLSSNATLKSKTLPFLSLFTSHSLVPDSPPSNPLHFPPEFPSFHSQRSHLIRYFSSTTRHSSNENDTEDEYDEEEEEDDDDDDVDEEDGEEGSGGVSASNCVVERANSTAEKEKEAAAIGYRVIGPLDPSERPFKYREPAFAIVQIGSHQFKVSNGDLIYTERLKHCEVNDKLILNRVLMVGSKTQTIIGRPILPDTAVHAVVEEHALDAKVIIFKKKRRKNYRRTKGHRQELTRLRITDIQGIEKAQKVAVAA
eukprot:TRINITY_DN1475_c0_g3_i3.p1 TRINITY_DN1475_c0_g3~~TRINITY_DN1475_c0_g3_i3.p1  ORF type:complete len:270 (-),score=60.08 TRINITY_DN1475_c0_g3_i3:461-1270(-)